MRRSCTPTWMRSLPLSSSVTTPGCAASPSSSAAGWCWRAVMRPRPAVCAARWAVSGRSACARMRSWWSRGCRPIPRRARTSSRSSAAPPRWWRGCRSTRRSWTSAGCAGSPGSPPEIAARLRAEVLAKVGLRITVGVAGTKFLAKVASAVAKPDGLLVVPPGTELDFLHPAAGPAAVGGRAEEHREVARHRHLHRRPGRRHGRGRVGLDPGSGVRPAPERAGSQPRSASVRVGHRRRSIGSQHAMGRSRHLPSDIDAVDRRAGRPGHPADAGRGPHRTHRHAAPALRRLLPGLPVAHAAARHLADRRHPGARFADWSRRRCR